MIMLALPGSSYLYQGEELGLPEHTALPDEVRQDPAWFRHGGTEAGRDGCRVPMPWEAAAPGYGFSPTGTTWLPQPDSYRQLAVDAQSKHVSSTLELYRSALRNRREAGLGEGTLRWDGGGDDRVLVFTNCGRRAAVSVLVNFGVEAVPLPTGADVLLSSGPLDQAGRVPEDVAVWFVTTPDPDAPRGH